MSKEAKEIILLYEDLQNEYLSLFEKINILENEINIEKERQKQKLIKFKLKLLEYKSYPYNLEKNKNISLLDWNLEFSK